MFLRDAGQKTFPQPVPWCMQNTKPKSVHVVDVPGDPRLRGKLDEYLPRAQAIVFLVDAVDFIPSLGATSEYVSVPERVATGALTALKSVSSPSCYLGTCTTC